MSAHCLQSRDCPPLLTSATALLFTLSLLFEVDEPVYGFSRRRMLSRSTSSPKLCVPSHRDQPSPERVDVSR
ncbi:hypothetical protein BD311DRAFT_746866 [Dichomitus squalens]|uniref:Secreted protein n=1 Tax=Dichomitus squalens TaxID=114155 RepID=A0A4Q9N293_9APHY|nr:hypothetical protein BD311DRAFT_746866 [Dichomitus squalens]